MKRIISIFAIVSSIITANAQNIVNSTVIQVENGKAYLDVGSSKAKVGDVYSIKSDAGYMIHPVTKEKIKKEGEIIADLEIVSTYSDYSVATIYPEEAIGKINAGMVAEIVEVPREQIVEELPTPVVIKENRASAAVKTLITLNTNTEINYESLEKFHRKKVGSQVRLRVTNDVYDTGKIVLPKGTILVCETSLVKYNSIFIGSHYYVYANVQLCIFNDGNQSPASISLKIKGRRAKLFESFRKKIVIPQRYKSTATVI